MDLTTFLESLEPNELEELKKELGVRQNPEAADSLDNYAFETAGGVRLGPVTEEYLIRVVDIRTGLQVHCGDVVMIGLGGVNRALSCLQGHDTPEVLKGAVEVGSEGRIWVNL